MALGIRPLTRFNHTACAYLPKGNKEGDIEEIVRDPLERRPLGLRNTDCKIVSGAQNFD